MDGVSMNKIERIIKEQLMVGQSISGLADALTNETMDYLAQRVQIAMNRAELKELSAEEALKLLWADLKGNWVARPKE